MKRLWLLVVFYCIVHGASGDFALKYEGQDKKTITQLIHQTHQAKFDFVDQTTYAAFLAKHKPKFS